MKTVSRLVSALLVVLMLASTAVVAFGAHVTASKAQDIALADAKVARSKATFTKTKLEFDDGVQFFEVEFRVKTSSSVTEYEYDIRLSDGRILDRDIETKRIANTSTGKEKTRDEAIAVALADARVKKENALKLSAKRDVENGRVVYEIRFYIISGNKLVEYEYSVLASNGRIVEKDVETEATAPGKVTGLNVSQRTARTVTLRWSRVARATGYIVYRYDSGTKKYVKVGTTKALNYKVTGLSRNTSYTFAVRPYLVDEGITLPNTSYTRVAAKTTK